MLAGKTPSATDKPAPMEVDDKSVGKGVRSRRLRKQKQDAPKADKVIKKDSEDDGEEEEQEEEVGV